MIDAQAASDPGLSQSVVYDLHKSLDKDACKEGLGYETLVSLDSIQSQLVHF